jgi:hypothetical protein
MPLNIDLTFKTVALFALSNNYKINKRKQRQAINSFK